MTIYLPSTWCIQGGLTRLTASPPLLGKVGAVALGRRVLVQPLQRPVHLLVESPVRLDRHPRLVQRERERERERESERGAYRGRGRGII